MMRTTITDSAQSIWGALTNKNAIKTYQWFGRAGKLLGLIVYATALTAYDEWQGETGIKIRSFTAKMTVFCLTQANQFVKAQLGESKLLAGSKQNLLNKSE